MQHHLDRLGDPEVKVSSRAENYLYRYYMPEAIEPLIEATYDPNPVKRFRAGWLLGLSKDPRAFEHLATSERP